MPRKGASSHRTKSSKETLNINQKIKKRRDWRRNNNLLMINNKLILYKNEAKGFWITYEIRKRIKDVKMKMKKEERRKKKEIDFEHLESEILEMEKNVVTNKELKFAFAQPTNWDNFSDEDDSESQEGENDSRSQVSQRKHLINKTQEVWVNKEFEDDLDNSQSVKKKSQIVLIKLKKI